LVVYIKMSIKQFIEDNFIYIFTLVLIFLSLITFFYIFDINFKPAEQKVVYQKEMVFPLV